MEKLEIKMDKKKELSIQLYNKSNNTHVKICTTPKSTLDKYQPSGFWLILESLVLGVIQILSYVILYLSKKKMFKILTSVQEKKLYPYAHLLVDETYQCLHNVTLLFL